MRKLQTWLLLLLLLTPLFYSLAAGFWHDPHAVPFGLGNHPAPDFALHEVTSGKLVRLHDFAGKPLLINFWATWCVPCVAEHELLMDMAKRYTQKVQFLGIVFQDDTQAIDQFLAQHPSRYPQLLDASAQIAIDYGVSGIPESFLLDSNGMILRKQTGMWSRAQLQNSLDALLSVPVATVMP